MAGRSIKRSATRTFLAFIAFIALTFLLRTPSSPPPPPPSIDISSPHSLSSPDLHPQPNNNPNPPHPVVADTPPKHNAPLSISNRNITENEPDPRFDSIALVVKSGKDIVDQRWTSQYNSFLKALRNVVLVGDANLSNVANTGVNMYDVVHGIYELAQARVASLNSNTSPRLNRRRIEDTQGWKDDAHKFLPAIRLLYEKHSTADWYVIADDDAYFFVENLYYSLQKLNPADIKYMGIPTLFVGCDGVEKFGDGPLFGHGGSGIIMSKAAVTKMLTQIDHCIIKYRDCWAGDIRVSLCMRDVGIKVELPLDYQLHQVPPTLDQFRYPHDACIRPITFHHLKPDIMAQVHDSVKVSRQRIETQSTNYWSRVSNKLHPHLYLPSQQYTDQPWARYSPHYAPVHFADVYHVFVGSRYTDPDAPIVHLDMMRNSDAYIEFNVDPSKSLTECQQKCIADPKCRAWDLNLSQNKCRLIEPIPKLERHEGSMTGIIRDRFKCASYSY